MALLQTIRDVYAKAGTTPTTGAPKITNGVPSPSTSVPTNVSTDYAWWNKANDNSVKDIRNSYGLDWQRKWAEERYKDLGYKLGARPYEFDQSQFNNPYYNKNSNLLSGGLRDASGRTLDQAGQNRFADMLMAQYQGNGPSLAQGQYRQNVDQNIKAALAMGNRSPSAMRSAQYSVGDMNAQAANQSAQLRAQEQLAAGQLLQQQQQMIQQGVLEQQRANDAMVQYYTSQGLSLDQAQWAAQMELQRMKGEQHIQAQSIANKIGAPQSGPGFWERLGGGLIGAGAELGSALITKSVSDRIAKKDISRVSKKDLVEFLSSVKGYKYRYKDSKWGKGEHFSPMAQDLEKTKIGKSMVIDTPEGKMVDYGKGFGALLAAQAELYNEVKKLGSGK